MFLRVPLWVVVVALFTGLTSSLSVRRVRAEDDGPAPINSTESISASARDDLGPGGAGSSSKSAAPEGHPAGTYAGVSPGGDQPPPIVVAAGQTPATITWPGFQMRPNGTSRVFFQSTVPTPVQTSGSSGKFVMKLPGAHVVGNNNRLPLETRFFNTPVTRVSMAVARDSVTITLELRAQVMPQVSAERGASGYWFTYIDLPAGNYLSEAERSEAAGPASSPQAAAAINKVVVKTASDTPTFLEDSGGSAKGSARVQTKAAVHADTSMDRELPPGMKPTAKAQASGGIKFGK